MSTVTGIAHTHIALQNAPNLGVVLAGAALDGSDQGKAEAAQRPVRESLHRRTKLPSTRAGATEHDSRVVEHAKVLSIQFASCIGDAEHVFRARLEPLQAGLADRQPECRA